MKYLYGIGIVLLVGLGLYVSTQVQIQAGPTHRIPFTQYAEPEELGRQIADQFQEQLKKFPVLFVGVTPNQIEDVELWRGFFEKTQATSDLAYDILMVEPMLPYVELLDSNMRMDLKAESHRFVEGVRQALVEGLRVAVVAPSIYTSQLLNGNPASLFKTQHALEFLSFSVTKFPVTAAQEAEFDPSCTLNREADPRGTGKLGCAIRQSARPTYRQPTTSGQYSGLVDELSPQDYLVLFNRN